MKYPALASALLGLIILAALFYIQKPLEITGSHDLTNLKDNQLISLSGTVAQENYKGSVKYLTINNIELKCLSCPYSSYKNKNVSITGIISYYNNKKEIHVLSIALN